MDTFLVLLYVAGVVQGEELLTSWQHGVPSSSKSQLRKLAEDEYQGAAEVGESSVEYSVEDIAEYSLDGCPSTCHDLTCDDWLNGDYEYADTLTCGILEESYGCDCSGCMCETVEEDAGCPSTCHDLTCDDWLNGDYEYADTLTCGILEESYGCDCSGCMCETVEEDAGCPSTCYDQTCDNWLNGDYEYTDTLTCGILEESYGCDCSGCMCEDAVFTPFPSSPSHPLQPLQPSAPPPIPPYPEEASQHVVYVYLDDSRAEEQLHNAIADDNVTEIEVSVDIRVMTNETWRTVTRALSITGRCADGHCAINGGGHLYVNDYDYINYYNGGTIITREITWHESGYKLLVVRDGGHLTLTRLRLENGVSLSGDGGAVEVLFGTVVIVDCEFRNNAAKFNGGAVSVNNGTAEIIDSMFDSNQAVDGWDEVSRNQNEEDHQFSGGGAIAGKNGSLVDIMGSLFLNNNASSQGGAVLVTSNALAAVGQNRRRATVARIRRSVFENNYAEAVQCV
ncbi:hypothetical protein CYMTET_47879 [Cymbomonas tetramitiformis]|uniref:Right handed beta helix domain-containing protein n=1 Tax=Cymbomonas tetramitiformis TaxID=36881 RepID=A0AAE0EVJ4_9CHLO|nr:hypothetical protein CYMTET_47879 [Cymbomonas tetramitiformis]